MIEANFINKRVVTAKRIEHQNRYISANLFAPAHRCAQPENRFTHLTESELVHSNPRRNSE